MSETSNATEEGTGQLSVLSLSIRICGKGASPKTMEKIRQISPTVHEQIERFVERAPPILGRMLSDLCREGASSEDLRRRIWDPQSPRQAANATDLVIERGSDATRAAYSRLPENRWPHNGIKDLGLFFLAIEARSADQIDGTPSEVQISDSVLKAEQIRRILETMQGWHRAYATCAIERPYPPPPQIEPSPWLLEVKPLLGSEQMGQLEQIVSFDQVPSSLADQAQIKNRGAWALHFFIRLLQKPFALHFQKKIVFCSGFDGYLGDGRIQLSTASDPWTVVENLCAALDDMIGLEGSFRSIEPGPLKALAEEASKISGEPPTRALHCLMSQYLRMLCRQQGDTVAVHRSSDIAPVEVGRLAPLLLEILCFEQLEWIKRENKKKADHHSDSFLSSILVSVGLGTSPLTLPWAAR